ncbi:molecular chaperone DnaJ [Novacetimonas hansenii]|nr:molecular chaperone DnaJ [Novacetimonas hansenii]
MAEIPCNLCLGSGETTITCPACNGTGFDPLDGGQCGECHGDGSVEGTCPVCGGLGTIDDGFDDEEEDDEDD